MTPSKASTSHRGKKTTVQIFRLDPLSNLRPVGQLRLALFTRHTLDVLTCKLAAIKDAR